MLRWGGKILLEFDINPKSRQGGKLQTVYEGTSGGNRGSRNFDESHFDEGERCDEQPHFEGGINGLTQLRSERKMLIPVRKSMMTGGSIGEDLI